MLIAVIFARVDNSSNTESSVDNSSTGQSTAGNSSWNMRGNSAKVGKLWLKQL